MRPVIDIDPNVRVHGNDTYAGFEDVVGPLSVGSEVAVRESEVGLLGIGWITEIDVQRELVYLSVDWAQLHVATVDELQTVEDDAELSAGELIAGIAPKRRVVSVESQPWYSSIRPGGFVADILEPLKGISSSGLLRGPYVGVH